MRRRLLILVATALLLVAFLPSAGDAVAHSRIRWCVFSVMYARGPSFHSTSCSVVDRFTQGIERSGGALGRGRYTYPSTP